MALKEVVIVTGAEYEKYEPVAGDTYALRVLTPSTWLSRVQNWARLELRIPDTIVTIFDIGHGTQQSSTNGRTWTPVRGMSTPVAAEYWRITDNSKPGQRKYTRPVSPFRTKDPEQIHVAYLPGSSVPPNRTTLDDASFQPVGGPWLGIQDVYDYICRIGLERPGTLRALHLFAHADEGGPIFLNTWAPAPSDPHRAPLDIDCRTNQDFTAANIPTVAVPLPFADDAAREKFIAANPRTRAGFDGAWTDDATAVVWGCLGDHFVKAFVEQAAAELAAVNARAKASGAAPPADPDLTIRATNSQGGLGEEDRQFWAAFFGVNPAGGIPTSVTKPLSWVKQKLIDLNAAAYPGQLRAALGAGSRFPARRVLAAPLGAKAWVEEPGRDKGITPENALMRVVPNEFKRVLTFYRDVGFTYARDLADSTEFGRGYGTFSSAGPSGSTP